MTRSAHTIATVTYELSARRPWHYPRGPSTWPPPRQPFRRGIGRPPARRMLGPGRFAHAGVLPTATATCRTTAMAPAAPGTTHTPAAAPHIMILVMENEGYGQIIGNSAAPRANSLASTYLRATDSYARGHDSLPNYLEMISGHAYEASGTSNDCTPSSCRPITGTDIANQLRVAGIRWKAFMGAMPSNCATSDANGSGGYAVRHNPFIYFPQGRMEPACGNDVPAAGLLNSETGQVLDQACIGGHVTLPGIAYFGRKFSQRFPYFSLHTSASQAAGGDPVIRCRRVTMRQAGRNRQNCAPAGSGAGYAGSLQARTAQAISIDDRPGGVNRRGYHDHGATVLSGGKGHERWRRGTRATGGE